jgi:hypothetical protein
MIFKGLFCTDLIGMWIQNGNVFVVSCARVLVDMEFLILNVCKLSHILCLQLFFQWLSSIVAFQTSVACYLSALKLQEVQRPANVITDSEHAVTKSPHASSDSVPLSPGNSCGNSNNINSDNYAVVTDSPNNTCSSTNPSISLLSRNSGNITRTLVVNGSLQPDAAPCSKVSGLVNGPISLLKDKQVCVSLTNLSQQNGEFKNSSNNNNNNINHHNNNNNNNSNVQEDTNIVSVQCQKTCVGFGGAVIHHSNNNNNNNSGNKCVGGTTNQIVATKVVKPG